MLRHRASSPPRAPTTHLHQRLLLGPAQQAAQAVGGAHKALQCLGALRKQRVVAAGRQGSTVGGWVGAGARWRRRHARRTVQHWASTVHPCRPPAPPHPTPVEAQRPGLRQAQALRGRRADAAAAGQVLQVCDVCIG